MTNETGTCAICGRAVALKPSKGRGVVIARHGHQNDGRGGMACSGYFNPPAEVSPVAIEKALAHARAMAGHYGPTSGWAKEVPVLERKLEEWHRTFGAKLRAESAPAISPTFQAKMDSLVNGGRCD